MNFRALTLAIASIAVFVSSPVLAAEHNLYGTVAVGSTDTETKNLGSLSPSGTVVDVSFGDSLYHNGDLVVSVVAGITLGKVEASSYGKICDAADCGENVFEKRTNKLDGTVRAGVMFSDTVGPFQVSVGGGVMAARYTATAHYTYDVSPDSTWSETRSALGTYGEVVVSYPFTTSMAIIGRYGTSSLTIDESSGWSSEVKTTTVSVGLGWQF